MKEEDPTESTGRLRYRLTHWDGEALKQIRKRRRMTQTEAANNAGMTRGQWSHYELDLRTPTLETLTKMTEALRIEIIIGGRNNNKSETEEIGEEQSDREEIRNQSNNKRQIQY